MKSKAGKVTILLFIAVFLPQYHAQTVTIGNQVWMTKNLDVSTFSNGDPIQEAKTVKAWKAAAKNMQPAWCYYENDPANGIKYGKLYNFYAVYDPRGLAPAGYHIPGEEEWRILTEYLGGEAKAGAKMKSKLGWLREDNSTNSSGFSGLPGGSRNYDDCTFNNIGSRGYWWTTTESEEPTAWVRSLIESVESLGLETAHHMEGLSVRCLRD